jgi:hypothetical protein
MAVDKNPSVAAQQEQAVLDPVMARSMQFEKREFHF